MEGAIIWILIIGGWFIFKFFVREQQQKKVQQEIH